MNLEQRERETGVEMNLDQRERERRGDGVGRARRGVEMETNWEMRDERERSADGLETVRKEWRCTGNRERRD